ncbi:T9SS type A sorting domain-containing protein, partial [Flavobacterium enshiense]
NTGSCTSGSATGIVYPAKPSPPVVTNTCNAALTIPALTDVTGFTRQYSFDGGTTWGTSNSSGTTPGCYTMKTRYVLAAACGGTLAGAEAPCEASDAGNAVIFPTAPSAPTVNSGCGSAIVVTPPSAVTGFTIQYSFDDGVNWGANTPPTADNCDGYKIKTRYVITDVCGGTSAGTGGSGSCGASEATTRVLDKTAPTLVNASTACSSLNQSDLNQCLSAAQAFDANTLAESVAALYQDNCDTSVTATLTNTTPGAENSDCSWSFTYEYTIVDNCNNSVTCQVEYSGGDNEAPTLVDADIDCSSLNQSNLNQCLSAAEAFDASTLAASVAALYQDNCDTSVTATHTFTTPGTGNSNCSWSFTYEFTIVDNCQNSVTCNVEYNGGDNEAPTIPLNTTFSLSVDKTSLWPPNHKMVDIAITTNASDNCGIASGRVKVTSNEPFNAIGDGNTDSDIWIGTNQSISGQSVEGTAVMGDDGKLHIQLRAERSGVQALVTPDIGRTYTIEVLSLTDACDHVLTLTEPRPTTAVTVAHNITGPNAGKSIKLGETINLTGTFWDKPGNRHSVKWSIDGTIVNGVVTAEPSGNRAGKVSGSFKPTAAGVYKIRMNVTDQNGITSYATTNGDYEAYFVVYDPKGGYTYGGGKFISPEGALTARPNLTDKVAFGFASNYVKNATNPKGETQIDLKISDGEYNFGFNALNYDYLVVNGNKAQYKGLGKTIINGVEQGGLAFVLTVIDGKNQTTPTGSDKFRLKIYNKNTGVVIYDNQPGASETADPTTAIADPKADGTDIVVVSTPSGTAKPGDIDEIKPVAVSFNVKAYPNPSNNQFTFEIESESSDDINITVLDISGRLIKEMTNVKESKVTFGESLPRGVYFAMVQQGNNQKTIRIVKE